MNYTLAVHVNTCFRLVNEYLEISSVTFRNDTHIYPHFSPKLGEVVKLFFVDGFWLQKYGRSGYYCTVWYIFARRKKDQQK